MIVVRADSPTSGMNGITKMTATAVRLVRQQGKHSGGSWAGSSI